MRERSVGAEVEGVVWGNGGVVIKVNISHRPLSHMNGSFLASL